jgi:uncharacterized protein (DUF427 family)
MPPSHGSTDEVVGNVTPEAKSGKPVARVRTEPITVPRTPRLVTEAAKWTLHGRRPDSLVEPGPGQQSVWDYPRPPALERVLDRVTVEFAGHLIADTARAVRVCETASPPTYYIPAADVRSGCLRAEAGASICEWKGRAIYHSLVVGDRRAVGCAWSYPSPTAEYQELANMLAFYPGRVDRCTVGGFEVRPQPGEFYAGWVTPDLVGPFKGEPGSERW